METNDFELLHILLADDDAEDRKLFREILKRTPVHTQLTAFKNGVELLQHLEKADDKLPDFIFLDINMPVMDGKECLKKIRRNKMLQKMPVIICSTSSYKQDIDDTFTDGANLFVPKNLLSKEIFRKIFSIQREKMFKRDISKFVLS